jgi:cell wall-associated NlpC family hydrolase
MTLEEFVKKYNGKKVDYDNAYGAQCVDLFRQYTKECLGIKEHTGPCATSGGAKDLFLDYDKMPVEKKYFIRSKGKAYQPGDVLIWDRTEKNQYGHVAIFLAYLGNSVLVFQQNGITQAGAEIQVWTRDNLLGYLRKR